MKQTLLIALLALAGFTTLPAGAADAPAAAHDAHAAPAPEAAKPAAPENLSRPGKPCMVKGGMKGMMGGEGRPCPSGAGDCKLHKEMSARVEQLEKRLDALQMALEVLARQQVK